MAEDQGRVPNLEKLGFSLVEVNNARILIATEGKPPQRVGKRGGFTAEYILVVGMEWG